MTAMNEKAKEITPMNDVKTDNPCPTCAAPCDIAIDGEAGCRELSPCPFCGSDNLVNVIVGGWHKVECRGCGIQGRQCHDKNEMLDHWNRRTPSPAPSDLLTALRDLVVSFEYHSSSQPSAYQRAMEVLKRYETTKGDCE